jgi:hypothetical protein
MNFTSTCSWWPGRCFSYRFQPMLCRWYRWEAGGRFSPSRFKIRHTPEVEMVTSWSRARYMAILAGPKW